MEKTKRTITLTGTRPVTIVSDEWPVIAHGSYSDHDGENVGRNPVECQANRTWKTDIRVRQHADGRAIVYGVWVYDSQFSNESNLGGKAGVLFNAGGDVIAAIREVAATMEAQTERDGADGQHVEQVADECIADLPAEEI